MEQCQFNIIERHSRLIYQRRAYGPCANVPGGNEFRAKQTQVGDYCKNNPPGSSWFQQFGKSLHL